MGIVHCTLKLTSLIVKMGKICMTLRYTLLVFAGEVSGEDQGKKNIISVRMNVKSIRLIIVRRFHFVKTCIFFLALVKTCSFLSFPFNEHTASVMVVYTNLKSDLFQKQMWHADWLLYRAFSQFLIPKYWIANYNSIAKEKNYSM